MGLSRKLGGGTVSSRADPPDRVEYQWSTQAYTLREILARFQLPCVVQCSGDPGTVLWDHFRFDMRQPLLLHAARTVRKIHSRSLQMDGISGKMEEFGPPLAIPEDYDGWFFPVNKADPSALPKYMRIEEVAKSEARKFLVTTTLPAFTPRQGPENGPKLIPHEVTQGEVLTKVGFVKADVGGNGSASPSVLLQRKPQNLQCVDESQNEVVIPFSNFAQMFDVSENYGKGSKQTGNSSSGGRAGSAFSAASTPTSLAARKGSVDVVYIPGTVGVVNTCTIVEAGNPYLPRVFRHVLGDPPALTDVFTGLLRCYSVFTEETVMAATMSKNLASMSDIPACLELSTDSSARFNIALNAADLKRTNQYNAALTTCEEQAPSYVRAMKTSFTVQPVVSDLDDVDLSLYETTQPYTAHVYERALSFSSESEQGTSADEAVGDAIDGDYVNIATVTKKTARPLVANPDDESLADDVESESAVETNSLSDYTDGQSFDNASMSDAVEVEASSEFDISWGQLKRAQSFTGSISSQNSDSESSTIHSDSEDSDHSTEEKEDDACSSISQDSENTMSSASQDTVVFRQSRIPNAQAGGPFAASSSPAVGLLHRPTDGEEEAASNDDDTVSEVSSFSEADIDGMFRLPRGTVLEPAVSDGNIGVDNGEASVISVEEDGQEIVWGDSSAVSTAERQRKTVPSHSEPDEGKDQTREDRAYDGVRRLEALLQGADGQTVGQESIKQQNRMNGVGRTTITADTTNYAKNNLTQPYMEIPRRSRTQSHPDTATQQSGLTTFSTFHSKPKFSSSNQINEVPKERRPRYCESDPDFIREKDDRNNEGQIDLEFVRLLGEKLLAASKRSSAPKYQRLEAEKEVTSSIVADDQRRFKLNSSSTVDSRQFTGPGSNTEHNRNKVPPKRNVVLDGLDLLQEEIV